MQRGPIQTRQPQILIYPDQQLQANRSSESEPHLPKPKIKSTQIWLQKVLHAVNWPQKWTMPKNVGSHLLKFGNTSWLSIEVEKSLTPYENKNV